VTGDFVTAFRKYGASPQRGKFLSRVFGIFSEEIVRIWARDAKAPYDDLGRPTLYHNGHRSTLDFLFRCCRSGKKFVVEQKCEIEYQNYKFVTLEDKSQLEHHNKPAFAALLAAAQCAEKPQTKIGGKDGENVSIDGAILIWGATTKSGRESVMNDRGFSDVLSLEQIIADLQDWQPEEYINMIGARRNWSEEMFDYLIG